VSREDLHTGLDDSSEDGGGVDGGAVPSSMAELVLALVDGVEGARPHGSHQVDVAFADLALLFDEPGQLIAFFLLTHVVRRRDRRYRPARTQRCEQVVKAI